MLLLQSFPYYLHLLYWDYLQLLYQNGENTCEEVLVLVFYSLCVHDIILAWNWPLGDYTMEIGKSYK